ncbi:RNaseH domain-containing protein [Streptomyces antioxidans]|uniref:RNaseH domain-containing protein n=1 Tax=Streptomyces antioxidans TaxID=1507734 RepID=UPI0030B810AA
MAADKLAPRINTKGKLTVDTDKAAWNPGLVELAVLGCHLGDDDSPEALALAAHQLREAPDLPDALSLPLPLHLAGLAQEYVLPTRAEEDETPSVDAAGDADPDTGAVPGFAGEPEPREEQKQLSFFPTMTAQAL